MLVNTRYINTYINRYVNIHKHNSREDPPPMMTPDPDPLEAPGGMVAKLH